MSKLSRRAVLGLGATAAIGFPLSTTHRRTGGEMPTMYLPGQAVSLGARQSANRVSAIYRRETGSTNGVWNSFITVADPSGATATAVDDKSDTTVQAYSVNKIGVAVAVLDKVDRGLLRLDQKVDVTASMVAANGDGIFPLDGAYPSSVTLGHVLANLLSVSDDTAVRLCGLVCPGPEINDILKAKGFPNTQMELTGDPHRFFLGTTTPRDMHDLLRALVTGTLLAKPSTDFLVNILKSPVAFTDGIRRNMSTRERAQVATKAGWLVNGRHEVGVMFDVTSRPILTYSLFARYQTDMDNFAATHPALEARAVMGREFFDTIIKLGYTAL
jgi:beta-lactamase class A